ncbi:hypothetical protein LLEC1_02192 [Akanthomyces lecanii]|uniref:Fungal N-terminal domain-containing protein n=1 Tax=Cordyceps confragosa TaxID=2714763 RepID=A0A179IHC5_CORDF|nr:hypothetical protein LLEC1_02192 [Akanthomyces lecanii]
MVQDGDQDSPLSITSNVAGLLTFVFAVAATAYARIQYLQTSSTEYLRVKTSLSWYKTESTWLSILINTQEMARRTSDEQETDRNSVDEKNSAEWLRRRRTGLDRTPPPPSQQAEHQMFAFVMEDLLNIEQRLLDVINEVESRAEGPSIDSGSGLSWLLVPGAWHGGRPSVAVAWLGVRTKALELVRQREALTERVQFLQLSMIASRLQALEGRVSAREAGADESTRAAIAAQAAAIRKLESDSAAAVDSPGHGS